MQDTLDLRWNSESWALCSERVGKVGLDVFGFRWRWNGASKRYWGGRDGFIGRGVRWKPDGRNEAITSRHPLINPTTNI